MASRSWCRRGSRSTSTTPRCGGSRNLTVRSPTAASPVAANLASRPCTPMTRPASSTPSPRAPSPTRSASSSRSGESVSASPVLGSTAVLNGSRSTSTASPIKRDPRAIELTDRKQIAIVIGTPPPQIPKTADFSKRIVANALLCGRDDRRPPPRYLDKACAPAQVGAFLLARLRLRAVEVWRDCGSRISTCALRSSSSGQGSAARLGPTARRRRRGGQSWLVRLQVCGTRSFACRNLRQRPLARAAPTPCGRQWPNARESPQVATTAATARHLASAARTPCKSEQPALFRWLLKSLWIALHTREGPQRR